MNKAAVIGIAVFVFIVAAYNVFTAFQSERDRRVVKIEQQRLLNAEAKQTVRLEREAKEASRLEKVAEEKHTREALNLRRKLEQEQKIAQYNFLRESRKVTKEDKRLASRIDSARQHKYIIEGLPRKVIQGIESATYLTIRNNPKDYIGNYEPSSILKSEKLTSGGADGLMLFSMISVDLSAIEEIINIGHDVNAKNKMGYTPLMFASAYNTADVVKFLLDKDVDKTAIEYQSESNALHIAARYNPKPEVLDALVKSGIDLETVDKHGNTPLLIAAKFNKNLQVVEKLMDLGASIKAADKTGNVAYSYAVKRTKKQVPMGSYDRISKEFETEVLAKLLPNSEL